MIDVNDLKRKIAMYAVDAYKSYFTNETPLDDSIAKIAFDNDLSQKSIKRVCETTNHLVQDALMKEASLNKKDKSFFFKLADYDKVMKNIDNLRGNVKSASLRKAKEYSRNVLDNDIVNAMAAANVMNLFKDRQKTATLDEIFAPENTESYREMLLDILNINLDSVTEKIASIAEAKRNLAQVIHENIEQVFPIVRSTMLNDDATFTDVLKVASARLTNQELFQAVFQNVKEELIKVGTVVDKKYIAEPLATKDHYGRKYKAPIGVVNGDHKLVMILDTINNLGEQYGSLATQDEKLYQAKDAITREIHDVTKTDDVRKFVERFYRKDLAREVKEALRIGKREECLCPMARSTHTTRISKLADGEVDANGGAGAAAGGKPGMFGYKDGILNIGNVRIDTGKVTEGIKGIQKQINQGQALKRTYDKVKGGIGAFQDGFNQVEKTNINDTTTQNN